MKDNSRIKFQWNWPKLETEKWWLLAQKNKNIKKTMYLLMKLSGIWNWKKWSYLCGIWSVSKITFEQFQNQKNPGIFEKWQTFFRLFFFFGSLHFFLPKITKKIIFWYSISVKKIRFRGGNWIFNYLVETICSFRPVSKKRPETVWNCQSFTETG